MKGSDFYSGKGSDFHSGKGSDFIIEEVSGGNVKSLLLAAYLNKNQQNGKLLNKIHNISLSSNR